ncbi:MAG: DNA-binding domain-containing protein [Chloroherpetonaceae bacterium]|nr:DNA-binding domain-containing protein [Chloroherpetonaceae bacterium]
MPINYYLQPNPITPDPNDQSARVIANDSLTFEDIITKMTRRGTLVTETDARAVLNLFFEVVADEVADGNFVNLPLVNIRSGISGVFDSVTDSFDPSRHTVRATVSSGTLLTEKFQNARVEKTLQPIPSPTLLEFLNVNTNTVNSIVTPGGIGQIVGEELKFNPQNPDEGVFFVRNDGTETKVAVYATRTQGKLMFNIPPTLTAGTYTLDVRRSYTKDNTVRKGSLSDFLTVP